MAILRFIGFCIFALFVTITALSFAIVAWTTPKTSPLTRLVTTACGLGSVVVSVAVGLRLFLGLLHPAHGTEQ